MIYAMEQGYLSRYTQDRDRAAGFKLEGQNTRKTPQLYKVIGRDAVLNISGVLQNNPDIFDIIFGTAPSLTYDEISQAIADAEQDDGVDRIVLDIDSPGGQVAGIDGASLSISTALKPTLARVQGMAASGAYWLASQAEKIEATSRLSTFGSIGVVRSAYKDPGSFDITSTNAPNKRPDPSTVEGQAAIRKELDQIHEIFATDIARGRKISVEKVNSDFGKGGVMLAADAMAAGMIDSLAYEKEKEKTAVGGKAAGPKERKEVNNMTEEELKALKAAAYQDGVTAERARVDGLNAWKGINADADKAVNEAIASGKTYTEVGAQLAAAVAKGNSKTADGENATGVQTGTTSNGAGAEDTNVAGLTAADVAGLKALGMTMDEIRASAPKGV